MCGASAAATTDITAMFSSSIGLVTKMTGANTLTFTYVSEGRQTNDSGSVSQLYTEAVELIRQWILGLDANSARHWADYQ